MAFLSRQIQVPKGGLPAGYTRLDYIQADGAQYIDTGLVVNKSDYVRMILTADLVSSDNFAGANGYMQYKASVGNNTKCEITVEYKSNIETIYVDGSQHSTTDWTSTYSGTDVKLGIFKMGNSGNSWWSGDAQSGKLYICEIYDDGTLVRDFVPCVNAGGVYGLYDLVNREFYANAGSGSFTGG